MPAGNVVRQASLLRTGSVSSDYEATLAAELEGVKGGLRSKEHELTSLRNHAMSVLATDNAVDELNAIGGKTPTEHHSRLANDAPCCPKITKSRKA